MPVLSKDAFFVVAVKPVVVSGTQYFAWNAAGAVSWAATIHLVPAVSQWHIHMQTPFTSLIVNKLRHAAP